jgi:hypothetical protein
MTSDVLTERNVCIEFCICLRKGGREVKKMYRTVWIDESDWLFLQEINKLSGLGASLLTARAQEVLVKKLRASKIIEKANKELDAGKRAQIVRAAVAKVISKWFDE